MIQNNSLIKHTATIATALKKLNTIRDVSRLILFVVDDNEVVIGSLTDGDVRRSLVKDEDLTKAVGDICFKNFIYHQQSKNYFSFKAYLNKNIKMLPILSAEKKLIEVVDLERIKAQLPLECMIMAGGRGKRLSPLTDTVPKPMLPLADKPIIEYNIDRLIAFGIKKIYITVKYLGEQIQDYFGDGSKKGISIEYIWENEPLGTAGALALVDSFATDNILLMNSDLFTNVDFEFMYLSLLSENSDMVVASTEYKIDVPYAIFQTKEKSKVISFQEKPSYIYHSNAGIYIFKKELIKLIPKHKFFDITDLMDVIITKGKKIVHCPIRGYWIDIGKPVDYMQAQDFVKHINN